ncbi:UPF0481 protein At3g47200 isoform X2 [Cajanus cajan]|uniref:UPF0481 protein At3g47200 isoform X2 n=1 Tax=Cajanus cajan TaxID=3821 RepID=UPI00098DA6F1|nr:UPF0481 protein At3g47200 isoform X2 [Cajanus cajan]XP_029125923.1 UPF0481 protein At3g47200 isoform X2 [Cajanus cajan]XP_029125924.1 UPF0481 protein At3g47200 isoform X2 [Cajanus cajan]
MMDAIDFEAMLNGAEAPVTAECCIYRVPFPIRKHKEDAYTPNVVSIGPFHHNRHPRLLNMERHKLSYCKSFLQRTNTTWDCWIRYIEGLESHVRRCYSDTLEFSKEELVKIIFVDSSFILELFCIYHAKVWSSEDVCLSKPWLDSMIRLDLLLLENQLPFSILQALFNKFFIDSFICWNCSPCFGFGSNSFFYLASNAPIECLPAQKDLELNRYWITS